LKQIEKAADAIKLQIVCWEWSMAKSARIGVAIPRMDPRHFHKPPMFTLGSQVPTTQSRPRPPFLEE